MVANTGGASGQPDAELAAVEQHMLERAREYVAEVVLPRARELDAEPDPEQAFSWEFMERAHECGLRTLRLSRENGGSGLGFRAVMNIIREIAKGDGGVAAQLAQLNHLSRLVEVAGTDEQVGEYLLPVFVDDPRFVLAIGSTEPDIGSDAQYMPKSELVQYRTTAERRDGGWVLNGKKQFIHNGNRASLYLIMAQTDPSVDLTQGSECFLVKGDSPGIRGGIVHDKMGERLANHAETILEDCWVPDNSILRYQGEEERGSALLFNANPGRAVLAGATVMGVAEAAYELTWQWVNERRQGGAQLIEHSSIQETVARMRMQIDAANAYLDRAAQEMELAVIGAERHRPVDRTLALLPKVFAAEVAWQVVGQALELHAGRGYMRDYGVEKLVRDAASWKHSEGANKTLLLRAMRIMRAM